MLETTKQVKRFFREAGITDWRGMTPRVQMRHNRHGERVGITKVVAVDLLQFVALVGEQSYFDKTPDGSRRWNTGIFHTVHVCRVRDDGRYDVLVQA